jgi:hypothetical protein
MEGGATQHCPECGFINNAGANFCQKCGAHLAAEEHEGDQTTITYKVGETGELKAVDLERSSHGGGRCRAHRRRSRGETFPIEGERVTIGRSPEATCSSTT